MGVEAPNRKNLRSALLAAALIFAATVPAYAQEPAETVPTETAESSSDARTESSSPYLSTLPTGYSRWDAGPVEWVADEGQAGIVEELRGMVPGAWRTLELDFGVPIDPELSIRIAQRESDLGALSPHGRAPTSASGVAWPAEGVIVLRLQNPLSHEPTDLPEVLRHELSHVALHRATDGADLPRWFEEGLAIEQSDERSLDRFQTLWDAAAQDLLIPLRELDTHFPGETQAVSVAYAQAADLVAFLHRQEDGRQLQGLVRVLAEVDDDGSRPTFDEALQSVYGFDSASLEALWRADIDERQSAIPSLVGGSTFWVLAILIGAWAFFKLRRRSRAKVARWSEEEQARERAAERLEAYIDEQIRARAEEEAAGATIARTKMAGAKGTTSRVGASLDKPTAKVRSRRRSDELPEHVARNLVSAQSSSREKGIPTVEHDGEAHTLH